MHNLVSQNKVIFRSHLQGLPKMYDIYFLIFHGFCGQKASISFDNFWTITIQNGSQCFASCAQAAKIGVLWRDSSSSPLAPGAARRVAAVLSSSLGSKQSTSKSSAGYTV